MFTIFKCTLYSSTQRKKIIEILPYANIGDLGVTKKDFLGCSRKEENNENN